MWKRQLSTTTSQAKGLYRAPGSPSRKPPLAPDAALQDYLPRDQRRTDLGIINDHERGVTGEMERTAEAG